MRHTVCWALSLYTIAPLATTIGSGFLISESVQLSRTRVAFAPRTSIAPNTSGRSLFVWGATAFERRLKIHDWKWLRECVVKMPILRLESP